MVAIKGMEMPKECYMCPLLDGEYGVCQIIGGTKVDMTEERAKNCPLVEIVTCNDCRFKHKTSDFYEAEYRCRKYLQAEIDGDFYCCGGRRE